MSMAFDYNIRSTPRVRLAAAFFVFAAILLAFAVLRAISIEPVPDANTASTARAASALEVARAVQVDPTDVVQMHLFASDRLPPAERYPMPGELRERVLAPTQSAPPRPTVLGTGVYLDGSAFATVQLPGAQPRIVRIGDRLDVYNVIAIGRGSITIRAPDSPPLEIIVQ